MNKDTKKINFSALNNEKEKWVNISPSINNVEKINNVEENKTKNKDRVITVHLWRKKEPPKQKEETSISLWKKSEPEKEDLVNIDKSNKSEIKNSKSDEEKSDKTPLNTEKLFSNYESDFNTKKDTIIEKLKKLKNLPKTRPKLIYSMIWVLIIWVSWLVIISPKDSTLNNYKASILWTKIEQKVKKQIPNTKNTIKTNNKNNIKKQKLENEKLKKQKLEKFLLKKQKLEKFLLKNNKNSNKIPKENIKIDKNKEKTLLKLKNLLESQKDK